MSIKVSSKDIVNGYLCSISNITKIVSLDWSDPSPVIGGLYMIMLVDINDRDHIKIINFEYTFNTKIDMYIDTNFMTNDPMNTECSDNKYGFYIYSVCPCMLVSPNIYDRVLGIDAYVRGHKPIGVGKLRKLHWYSIERFIVNSGVIIFKYL